MKATKGEKHHFCRKVPVLQYLYYLCQVDLVKKNILGHICFSQEI